MTQNLADKLILHYENTIDKIKETPDETELLYDILNETYTENGICRCSSHKFGILLHKDEWIKLKVKEIIIYGQYVYDIPIDFDYKEKIINCLQIRVDILKTFKEN